MKKLLSNSSLPIATLELTKSIARKISFLSFSLILLLMGMVNQQTKAQVMYYLGSDGTYNTYGTTDAIYRVNQDGSDKVRLVTGVSSPQEMVIDLPNNRAFVTSWSLSSAPTATPHGLYRIDLSTGAAVKMLATSDAFRIANLAYDPVNDYLYYTAGDGNGSTQVSVDGLYRIKGDGTGNIALATGISPAPTFIGIDVPNSKVYIYESVVTAPKLLTYTLSGNTATLSATRTAARYNGMDFDPVNNWLYFTSDNGSTDLTADDALWRMRPDGTEATKIIANLSPNPGFVTVERVNNVAFVWNSTAGDRRIVKVNIANGTSSAFAISPAFGLQNQATALVIPAASKIATLSGFSVSAGTLSPSFSTATTSYTASVINGVSSLTVTPTKTDNFASIKVNGTTVASGSASGNITLNVGDNVITTIVTAEDGLTTKTYTLTVNRAKAAQTISFNPLPAKVYGNADFSPGATVNSNLAISYSSSNTNVATIVNNQIHITGPGTANITASQAGDASRNAATDVVQNLTVDKATVTVKANASTKVYGNNDPTFTYTATGVVGTDVPTGALSRQAPGTNKFIGTYAIELGTLSYGDKYNMTYVGAILTINKRPASITANASTKVYGDNDPTFTYTATGFVGTDVPTGALSRQAPTTNKFIGTYAIELGTLSYSNSTNYDITYVGADLTITKRPFTIKPVGATKVFGDADPSFLSFSPEGTTLAPGDGTTGNFARSPGENAGSYATLIGQKRILSLSTYDDVSSNYNINFVSTNTFVITPKAITVTANPATKTFGSADPAFTYAVQSDITDATFTGSLSRTAGEEPGKYALLRGSLAINSNYTFSFIADSLTIGRQTLLVTPVAATKVYGATDPQYTFTTNVPIVGNSTFTGTPTREEGKNVGTYAVNGLGSLALDNPRYILSFGNPGSLTITKRPITLRPQPATKSYGNPDPTFPYQFLDGTSVAPGEGMTGLFGRAPGEAVGTYALTLGQKSPVDINTGTYTISNYEVTFISDNLTITPKRLDITATNVSKPFGEADPALSYTINQTLIDGDSGTGALARATGETRGTYAINQGTLSFGNNYQIYYNAGTFTIGKKTIDVTANAFSKIYGDTDPLFTYTTSSTPVGESFTGTLARTTGENVGTYPISKGSLSLSDNYIINFTGTDFNIDKAPLTYVASPTTRTFGTPNPTFQGAVIGFANGETIETSTTGTLLFSTTAILNSPMGTYPIIGSGLAATNYHFIQSKDNNSALTIIASADNTLSALTSSAPLTPTFSASELNYGASVANSITSFDLSATINSEFATATLNDVTFTSGSTKSFPLVVGGNEFSFVVTAQNETIKTYRININRMASANNLLANLAITGVTFTPSFDPNTTTYHATVPNSTANIDVYGTAIDTTAVVAGNNGLPNTAQNPLSIALSVGEYAYHLPVTAQNGSTRNYAIVVNRLPSADATLASFGNSGVLLNTPIVAGTLNYSSTVAHEVTQLYFIPVATNNRAQITVNGQPVNTTSGNYLPIGFNENILSVVVTSEDGTNTKTYTLAITRTPSNNARLGSLAIPFETSINESFNPDVYTYTATLADSTFTGLNLRAYSENPYATLKINGTPVARFADYEMRLHGGANTFNIVVTSQDGSATKTYTLVLTRAGQAPPLLSPNARLFSLSVSGNGNFSKNFNFAYESLAPITVANTVSSLNLFLYSENAGATAKVNGVVVPGANQEYEMSGLSLAVGYNLLNVVVTSQDGAVTKTYSIEVTRLPVANVNLASLTINNGTYTPAFNANTTTYNVTVPYSVAQLTVSPRAAVNTATISISGVEGTITPSNPSATVNLLTGFPNRIRMTVRAADGVSTKTYTLIVTRAPSDFKLAALTLSSGTLNPVFNKENLTLFGVVKNGVESIRLTPTTVDDGSTVTINGNVVTSGTASAPIPLSFGQSEIAILVSANDGAGSRTYTLTISRTISANAKLKSITLSTATALAATTGTANYNYSSTVPLSTDSIALKAIPEHGGAVINLNGVPLTAGIMSPKIALTQPTTLINMSVMAQDGTSIKTYTITINKASVVNLNLSALKLSVGTLSQAFNSANLNPTAEVTNAVTATSITPTAADPNSTITVNGKVVTSGTASDLIPTAFGKTAVSIVVTSANGMQSKTYALIITRTSSANAKLKSITVAAGSPVKPVVGTDDYNYISLVSQTTSATTIKAVPEHADAVLRINGNIVAAGTAVPISLVPGANSVAMTVTAQNGSVKTYTVTIVRVADVNLSALKLSTGELSTTFKADNASPKGSVGNTVTSMKLTPTAADATSVITVNGLVVANGSASSSIPIGLGQNSIAVVVTSADGWASKTYTLTISRTPSANAKLKSIELGSGTALTPTTGSANYNYRVVVAHNVDTVNIKAVTEHASAVIRIDGNVVASGALSAARHLVQQPTVIAMTVTAQDGITVKTYTITIDKAQAPLAGREMPVLLLSDKDEAKAVEVPTALSPNGDGQNDVLHIEGISTFPQNTLQIMNRAGTNVFKISNYDNLSRIFDGRSSNGQLLVAGTYFYQLEYKDGEQVKRKTGYIIIKY